MLMIFSLIHWLWEYVASTFKPLPPTLQIGTSHIRAGMPARWKWWFFFQPLLEKKPKKPESHEIHGFPPAYAIHLLSKNKDLTRLSYTRQPARHGLKVCFGLPKHTGPKTPAWQRLESSITPNCFTTGRLWEAFQNVDHIHSMENLCNVSEPVMQRWWQHAFDFNPLEIGLLIESATNSWIVNNWQSKEGAKK